MRTRPPADLPWTVVIHHNGQAVTGHVPITRWETASLAADLIAGITGGPISVMAAAVDPPDPEPQLTIYDVPEIAP